MISNKRSSFTTTLLKEKKRDLLNMAINLEMPASKLIELMVDYFKNLDEKEVKKILRKEKLLK